MPNTDLLAYLPSLNYTKFSFCIIKHIFLLLPYFRYFGRGSARKGDFPLFKIKYCFFSYYVIEYIAENITQFDTILWRIIYHENACIDKD